MSVTTCLLGGWGATFHMSVASEFCYQACDCHTPLFFICQSLFKEKFQTMLSAIKLKATPSDHPFKKTKWFWQQNIGFQNCPMENPVQWEKKSQYLLYCNYIWSFVFAYLLLQINYNRNMWIPHSTWWGHNELINHSKSSLEVFYKKHCF